jgi:hypothetical protein
VAIERFTWTKHAELRLGQRGLTRIDVEEAVREMHGGREVNRGDADWRIYGTLADGRKFAVIYDSPARGDAAAACIVSAWLLRVVGRR